MTVTNPFNDIEEAFIDRFTARITDGGDGGDPLFTLHPNDPRSPPADAMHAVLSVMDGARSQVGMGAVGARRHRTPGVAYAELFSNPSTGARDLRVLAGRVLAAFNGITVSGVRFRAPRKDNGSGDLQGGFWRLVIACPYYADDVA